MKPTSMNGSLLYSMFSINFVSRFGVAEQALNAIYLLASQPDVLCGDIVKEKTRAVFDRGSDSKGTVGAGENNMASSSSPSPPKLSTSRSLSQLLFIVGHVASIPYIPSAESKRLVKQIIHIDLCEAEFKRRKVELEKGMVLKVLAYFPQPNKVT